MSGETEAGGCGLDETEFDHTRLSIYLAGLGDPGPVGRSPVWRWRAPFLCDSGETRRSIDARVRGLFPGGLDRRYATYVRPAQSFFTRFARQVPFRIYAADNRSRFVRPTIVKSRLVADRDARGVLLPLGFGRHWRPLERLAAADRPFREKDDRLVWRGISTGRFADFGDGQGLSPRYHVARLGRLHDGIDVAYSAPFVHREQPMEITPEELRARSRGPLSMAQQLASKFLLSLEGNDVATGLKWMMASNSTVVMPLPTTETWFCEGELRPWVHFVPVAADLSDLAEVYDWCRSNLDACEEIARNGTAYVRRFLDGRNEMRLIARVVEAYADHAVYRLDFGRAERLAQAVNRPALALEARRHRRQVERCARGAGMRG